jgi:hypothetical protein
MPTDTTENGLETLITRHMTGTDGLFVDGPSRVEIPPTGSPPKMPVAVDGMPVSNFELKNSLTKQTVEDAVEQYRRDRTRGRNCSVSAAAWSTSPWMTRRSGCARN